MIGSIIEICIGWFVLEKMPNVVGAKGLLATIIKIVGVCFLIGGVVSLLRCLVYS